MEDAFLGAIFRKTRLDQRKNSQYQIYGERSYLSSATKAREPFPTPGSETEASSSSQIKLVGE